MNNIHIPTQIYFGTEAISKFILPAGRVLLLTSESINSETLNNFAKIINSKSTELTVFKKPSGEPYSSQIDLFFNEIPQDLSAIVGIGGGSVLDFAKALAILSGSGGQIADYEFGKRKINRALSLFLAPTTCGSGSEVTPYCVINNSITGRKFTLSNQALQPLQAAIDPNLLHHLPGHIRLETALDAFTHCLEAILTLKGNRLIKPIAEAGLTIGWKRLSQSADDNPSFELLTDLAQLSLYGGISIAHSRTGLIHTMSVAFSEFCNMSHGLLNARLLPYALAHNLPGYNGLLKNLYCKFSGMQVNSDFEAYKNLTLWLEGLIGTEPPAPEAEIRERTNLIVKRMLQDSGLPKVSHSAINTKTLTSLIQGVADASR